MLLNILLIFIGVGILALAVTVIMHIFLPVPYVPTPKAVMERMIELAKLKGNEVVYDLGAGDGRILIAAKRRFPGIRAIGVEVVPTIWLMGKVRVWLAGLDIDFRCGSIEHADVKDADTVFLYLIPSLMEKLEKKFDRELKEGAKVISSSFAFPCHKPIHSEVCGGKKLFVYDWPCAASTISTTQQGIRNRQ